MLVLIPLYFIPALSLLYIWYKFRTHGTRNPRRLPLPPGPAGLPFIGNVFDTPAELPWLTYNSWRATYGDILCLVNLGTPIIVLGSKEVAADLLDKRSHIYSSRIESTMTIELMGMDWAFPLIPYGPSWRKHRRQFQQVFHRTDVSNYLPVQLKETRAFLRRLLDTPADFARLVPHMVTASIMNIAYGIQVTDSGDEYVTIATEAERLFNEVIKDGPFMVDLIPALKHVPAWFPGASFQKRAAQAMFYLRALADKPFEQVKRAINARQAVPSIAATLLEAIDDDEPQSEAEQLIRNTCATIYGAGATTTSSALLFFFLAMTLHPEAQKPAQAELDAVVGPDRLPNFDDYDSLPYVQAVAREVMRWLPVGPLAVPHYTTADDEYNGYFIPKGSVVMANSWSILHDPVVYPEPEKFRPERYIKDGKLDPTVPDHHIAAYGYGRRICPGRFFADNTVFMMVASVLHVFDISPSIDAHGDPMSIPPDVISGLIVMPAPFPCTIKPRSAAAAALVPPAHA